MEGKSLKLFYHVESRICDAKRVFADATPDQVDEATLRHFFLSSFLTFPLLLSLSLFFCSLFLFVIFSHSLFLSLSIYLSIYPSLPLSFSLSLSVSFSNFFSFTLFLSISSICLFFLLFLIYSLLHSHPLILVNFLFVTIPICLFLPFSSLSL